MRKNLKNYTTSIKAEKTVMEIQALLMSKGAEKLMIDCEQGKPVGITFLFNTTKGKIPVKLPARIDKVQAVFYVNKNPVSKSSLRKPLPLTNAEIAQAERTGWRNIKDWIDAQIALIETEMVSIHEVFLPYVVIGDKTIFEQVESGQLRLGQAN